MKRMNLTEAEAQVIERIRQLQTAHNAAINDAIGALRQLYEDVGDNPTWASVEKTLQALRK